MMSGFGSVTRCRSQLVEDGEELVDPPAGSVPQVPGETLPVFRAWRLPWGQEGERFPDLLDRQPHTLRSPDHHCRRRDVHPPGYLADGQPAYMPVVFLHAGTVASGALDFN